MAHFTNKNMVEIAITNLAAGGDGIGYLDDKVCFVPYSALDDKLSVNIVNENKKFLRAEIVSVLEPGPSRRKPPCGLFGLCGGCNWLHITEDEQLASKRKILSHALRTEPSEFVASPQSFEYRAPARLRFEVGDDGEVILGFSEVQSKKTVDVMSCPILRPRLNECIFELRKVLKNQCGISGEIKASDGRDKVGICVYLQTQASPSFYQALLSLPKSLFSGVILYIDGIANLIFGESDIQTTGPDNEPFIYPAAGFSQANPLINLAVAAQIQKILKQRSYHNALELFCGAGNLTVTAAPLVKKMTVSELDEEACLKAKYNLKQRGLAHVSVISGDAPEVFDRYGINIDLLIINPPRTGHLELARATAQSCLTHKRPKGILYMSCNPATLARDVKELKDAGYRLSELIGFDMFPQTSHLESLALLEC